MYFSPLLNELIDALCCLPGVGLKSAQRMAFYLLQRERTRAIQLATCLKQAVAEIKHCLACNILSETDYCQICKSPKRNNNLLCIVETAADVIAIEQSASYQGQYFVLMGHLSPIEGIGPKEIGIPKLCQRLQASPIEEVILATNPTIEGEATAHYISTLVNQGRIKLSRIAHGVPIGGELEFIDSRTLSHAITQRKLYMESTDEPA